jgi:quercetin dioxygenase-like cupin family protein
LELLSIEDFKRLSNPGVISEQILSPHNSSSARITMTRVTVQPGATQPRHSHASSEQVWLAMAGAGMLLLANDEEREFSVGQLVRFSEDEVHGFRNTGAVPFVYLSVTSPPLDFSPAYKGALT